MIRLLKSIYKFPRVLKATKRFEEAWDLVLLGKNEEAELVFEQGEVFLRQLPYEFKIMKGQIKFNLRKRDECSELFIKSFDEIDSDNNLSTADKLYLKEYISSAIKIYDDFFGTDFPRSKLVSTTEVPLQKVSEVWKRRFPSRNHPDWDKYKPN